MAKAIAPTQSLKGKDTKKFLEEIKQVQTIYLEKQDIGFVDKQSMHAKRNGYSFSYREVNFFRSSMDLCIQEIQKGIKEGQTDIILNMLKQDLPIEKICLFTGCSKAFVKEVKEGTVA